MEELEKKTQKIKRTIKAVETTQSILTPDGQFVPPPSSSAADSNDGQSSKRMKAAASSSSSAGAQEQTNIPVLTIGVVGPSNTQDCYHLQSANKLQELTQKLISYLVDRTRNFTGHLYLARNNDAHCNELASLVARDSKVPVKGVIIHANVPEETAKANRFNQRSFSNTEPLTLFENGEYKVDDIVCQVKQGPVPPQCDETVYIVCDQHTTSAVLKGHRIPM